MQTCYNFSHRERDLAFSSRLVRSLIWEDTTLADSGWDPGWETPAFTGGGLGTVISGSGNSWSV